MAKRLLVCTATVYGLCASGRLGHVRVSNAVGVPEVALRTFLEEPRAIARGGGHDLPPQGHDDE